MSVIIFIIILAILVLTHELGHFIAAKRSGVRVDEFGIGFPPRLFSKKIGETIYSLNLLPVGGFVKIFGETPDTDSIGGKDSSRSLFNKSKAIQAWVISAGIIFNLLFAWVLISIGFMVGMPYSLDDSIYGKKVQGVALTITQVLPQSPAQTAGLKAGDNIIGLSAGEEHLFTPLVAPAQKFIATHDELLLTYLRDGKTETTIVRPRDGIVNEKHAIGVSLDMIGILKLSPYHAFAAGVTTTISITEETARSMVSFFKNIFIGQANLSQISGPVGIVSIVGGASALGFMHLISLTALISINLAVINILPFPALDGGRLLFIIIETITRSRIKPEIANAVNGIGFLFLITLMVFVTFHDVVKLMQG
ncbi:hypothetical protein AUJ77_02720 [Candidatus Nomurabacteria bacterium CG1_02_43_90]|uniref:PDZ domain-containing protein n=1 Tax=Candidatus Nomurabacteria bacterium CG1_02_43_90 TaxID=1805281 RepID=A0A1J4V402_9BACT|nr:MAG: hypothetical protein AUJ77_02720 [Candidatus Nomurabacteria bacterium CG1_02_43_90]